MAVVSPEFPPIKEFIIEVFRQIYESQLFDIGEPEVKRVPNSRAFDILWHKEHIYACMDEGWALIQISKNGRLVSSTQVQFNVNNPVASQASFFAETLYRCINE